MNVSVQNNRRVMSLLLAFLVVLSASNCAGPVVKPSGPLPTTQEDAPLLPGCKQLRAIRGEC